MFERVRRVLLPRAVRLGEPSGDPARETQRARARLAALAELAVYVFSLQMCRASCATRAPLGEAEKALLEAKKRDGDDGATRDDDATRDGGGGGDDGGDGGGGGGDDDDGGDGGAGETRRFAFRDSLPFARRSLGAETERASTRAC